MNVRPNIKAEPQVYPDSIKPLYCATGGITLPLEVDWSQFDEHIIIIKQSISVLMDSIKQLAHIN